MTDLSFTLSTIAVIAAVTMLLRFLPFLIFRGNSETPAWLNYLGKGIPYAAMGMLVIYCLKDIHFDSINHFLPELIACLAIALLHLWKKNTLLSIFFGTVFYMILVQFVFV